jgi:tetratricopeptide (TPR) repeat protein
LIGAICDICRSVLTNRAESLVCRFGQEFVASLTEVGVPRNDNALRAMRRAQLDALGSLGRALRAGKAVVTAADTFDRDAFLPQLDKFLQREKAAAERFALTDGLAKALADSMDATLAAPSSGTGRARLESFAVRASSCVWDEIGPLKPPSAFRILFEGREPGVPSWFQAYGAFLGRALKDPDFRAIFTADRLANTLGEVVDLREAVDSFIADSDRRLGELTSMLTRIEDRIQTIPSDIQAIVEASNRAWHGIRLETGRAEPATERIQIRPTELLLPRYCVAPFVDRGGLLSSILSWITKPSERRATGRIYLAPGGFGKTRLAIELIVRLEGLDWRCGFLPLTPGRSLVPGALPELMAGAGATGVCVLVDYAESLISLLGELADAASAAGSAGPPIRIVAFGRSAEGWWNGFAGDPSPSAIFDPTPFSAIGEEPSLESRSELFRQTRAAFIDRFRALGLPYQEHGQDPDLAKANSPLLIASMAFLDAIGADLRGRSVFQTLYEEERRHWQRALQVRADNEVADLARAVAQVTLVQGTTVDGADALMRADDADRSVRLRISAKLRSLYGVRAVWGDPSSPESEDVPFISGLEPDLLGEHMCMEVLQESGDPLLDATLRAALSGPPLFRDDAERVLAVLVRATHPSHDPRIRLVAERAIASIVTLVSKLTASQVGHLANSLPLNSLALSELALIVARRLAEIAPQDSSEAALRQRAGTQSYLSARLSRRGYDEEALLASEQAVKLHRALVEINRKEALHGLAAALVLHSQNLIQLGRRMEAVTLSEEAVEINRELAVRSPETIGSELAHALKNLGETYTSIGRKREALEASKEACVRLEALAKENPGRFLPTLASALNSLGNRSFQIGLSDEALKPTCRSVEIGRELVAKNRDAYLPSLAAFLNNFSRDLVNSGRAKEALVAVVESVEIHRELADKNRGGELLGLALALKGSAAIHFDAGQRDVGLSCIEESIGLLRELVAKGADAAIPELARALGDLGKILTAQKRSEGARAAYEDGARLIQPLAIKFPEAFKGLFEQLRDSYVRSALRGSEEKPGNDPVPTNSRPRHTLPEGVTAFDEAYRLLGIIISGDGAGIGLEEADYEETDRRLPYILAGQKAQADLMNILADNRVDETLEPIAQYAKYLMESAVFGHHPQATPGAKDIVGIQLHLNMRRAQVRAHPEDANARAELARELMSDADDPEHGAERLQELHDLRAGHPEDPIIRELDAWALHVESNKAGILGGEGRRDARLGELRDLSARYPADTAVRVPLAKSLKINGEWAISREDVGRRDAYLNELRALASTHPDDCNVRLALVEVLCAAGLRGLADGRVEEDLAQEMISIVYAHPDDKAVAEFFNARFVAVPIDEQDGSGPHAP